MPHTRYIIGFTFLGILLACRDQPEPTRVTPGSGRIILNDSTIKAGDSLSLRIQLSDEQNIYTLVWRDLAASTCFAIRGKDTILEISPFLTGNAGQKHLYLTHSGEPIDHQSIMIQPGPPSNYIESYLGPKTILFASKESSMLVMIPTDQYLNPVSKGTEVTVKEESGESDQQLSYTTRHGYAAHLINSSEHAGRRIFGGFTTNAGTIQQDLLVQSGWPVSFQLVADEYFPFADGRSVTKFSSEVLVDRGDNPIKDGTLINLSVYEGELLIGHFTGKTVNGRVSFHVLNPGHPCLRTYIALSTSGQKSNPISINYDEYQIRLVVRYNQDLKGIHVGPVQGNLGQLVPEGTRVTLEIFGNEILEIVEEELIKGEVFFSISKYMLPSGSYTATVSVLGVNEMITLEILGE
ncbi:MAG: hypothetical protein OEM26_00435 [Saprospiraceae bacterium]|nr:hypothetical protein [Saprospiraceae bacterium]